MDDVISRRVAIDAMETIGYIATMPDGDKCIRESAVKYTLSMLPSAQPETNEEHTETHACDLISRQAAIDALCRVDEYNGRSIEAIRQLPPAQPEIIRCKDCRNNHWCNIQEAAMAGDNFFCGAAERRTDERSNR